jgi:hypothetical protein
MSLPATYAVLPSGESPPGALTQEDQLYALARCREAIDVATSPKKKAPPVSKRVNSTKAGVDDPTLIEPVELATA